MEKRKKIQHLFNRAGFGAHPYDVDKLQGKSIEKIVDQIVDRSKNITPLVAIGDPRREDKEASTFKLGVLFLKSRKQLVDLNLAWLNKMSTDDAQLREKMTFFWHDHFATHVPFGYLMQIQNNTIRGLALGKFGDLLHSVSKDPAMILYLNNQQNKKRSPNENFAREVMELFTLGEGNYTEKDIKESARAFTGWSIDKNGKYIFNKNVHDFGEKTFMGRTGYLNGDDIINILLEQKQTARFIVEKVYKFFVNPILDEKIVEELAKDFYNSNYDITELMRNIFSSDWFYDDQHAAALIKSPVELLVNYQKLLKAKYKNDRHVIAGQRALGQVLFFPPNVAGWPGHTNWIDSSTLMTRMKLPLVLFASDVYDLDLKPDFEEMGDKMSVREKRKLKFMSAKTDLTYILKKYMPYDEAELPDQIISDMIAGKTDRINKELLLRFADKESKKSLIKSLVIRTMALPEFQLA